MNRIKRLEAEKETLRTEILLKENEIDGLILKKKDIENEIEKHKNAILSLRIKQDNTAKNSLEFYEKQRAILEEKISVAQESMSMIEKEMESITRNIQELLKQREALLSMDSASSSESLSLMLFSSIIQEYLTYNSQLHLRRYSLQKEIKDFEVSIEDKLNKIKNKKLEMEKLENEKDKQLEYEIRDIEVEIKKLEVQKEEYDVKINEVKDEIAKLKIQIESVIPAEIADVNQTILGLEASKSQVHPIKVVSSAQSSPYPTWPNKKLIVLLFLMGSVILCILIIMLQRIMEISSQIQNEL